MAQKQARFIKLSKTIKSVATLQTDRQSSDAANMMKAVLAVPASRISPCRCIRKNNNWYCMKPDKRGRFIMVDGPFATEKECLDEGVCG